VAHFGEWYADNVSRRHPPLTVGMMSVIGKYLYFDGTKARADLGFEAKPCEGAIQRCIDWFRESGKI
jgi:nucleoside-diphosphate-sugar epimerase